MYDLEEVSIRGDRVCCARVLWMVDVKLHALGMVGSFHYSLANYRDMDYTHAGS